MKDFLLLLLLLFVIYLIAYFILSAIYVLIPFLCIIAIIFGVYWIFKMLKKRRKLKSKIIIQSSEILDFDTVCAKETLDRAKELANTINTTLDRDVFEQSLRAIKEELASLQRFEGKVDFYGSTPTKDLQRIEENEYLTRQEFEKRIAKSQTTERADIKLNTNCNSGSDIVRDNNTATTGDSGVTAITHKMKISKNSENRSHMHKTNEFDLERFMIACNAQMEHDDEMEQYKDLN